MHKVVCLVVDECHRATGNYATVLAVRKMINAGLKFRIVGLSATPGGSRDAVQEVLSNLHIARLAFKTEEDPDVRPYVHNKQVCVVCDIKCQ